MKIQNISLVFQKSILHISIASYSTAINLDITRTFILKYFTEFVLKLLLILLEYTVYIHTYTYIYVFFFMKTYILNYPRIWCTSPD